ncbi:MAG: BsuPI-related putative proteinase inhibitor [Acidimicrobiales bacterium]|nr:BsuPI-related putative proteinase inhibitor [Acidimicrobiales bacterium]
MSARGFAASACFVLAVAACGSDDDPLVSEDAVTTTVDPSVSTTALADLPAPATVGEALEIELVSDSRVVAGPHVWTTELRNTSDGEIVVTFPTSQRGDVALSAGGEVVHRWSADRFFQQQVSEVSVAPGAVETVELEDDLSSVDPGFYEVEVRATVVGTLAPVTDSVRVVSP